ncbi:MAG: hypothetical protein HZB53_06355 [Chloroflexi bacterium]|nr:hypothetical protein [Chloroflexota bacterium]
MAGTEESGKATKMDMAAADAALHQFADARAQELVGEAVRSGAAFTTNPDAALFQTAGEMKLGAALSDEVRFSLGGANYIAQGFGKGILYVEDGNWESFRRIDWPAKPATGGTLEAGSSGASEGGRSGSSSITA